MFRFSRVFLISSAIVTTFGGFANAETLSGSVQSAVQNHPSVMAALAGEEVSRQDIKEQQSAYYPTASAGASFGRIYADNTTTRGLTVSRGAGYSWFGEGTGSLSQKLYDFNATRHGIDAAKARYQSAGASREVQILSVELQAAQAYLQLLRAQELLNTAKTNMGDMESYYKRIKTAFDNGGADESEVTRAQDFVSLAKNTVLQYETDLKIAAAGYKEIVGNEPQGELEEPSFEMSNLPQTLGEAITKATSYNPQIDSSALEVKATEQDLKREKSAFYPDLNAELSYMQRDQKDIIGGESTDGRALVRMNWDYNFGGAQTAAQKRAAAIKQEAEFNLEATNRLIERDVEVAWHSLHLASEKKKNEYDRLNAAQKHLPHTRNNMKADKDLC